MCLTCGKRLLKICTSSSTTLNLIKGIKRKNLIKLAIGSPFEFIKPPTEGENKITKKKVFQSKRNTQEMLCQMLKQWCR